MLSPRQQLAAMGITLAEVEADEPEEERAKFKDVEPGPEYLRIRGLPRRPIPSQHSAEAQELADLLYERLAKTADPYPGRPRTIAALSLREAWENRGAFMMLRVGSGKTWCAAMMPVLLSDLPGERPLYVCPAKMEGPVHLEFSKFSKDWHTLDAHAYPIVSYEKLSSPKSGEVLDDQGNVLKKSWIELYAPTILILDESHMCANTGATVTKRINAYLEKFPNTVVVAMTGTPFKTSIKDAQHIMRWCLKDKAPLPNEFLEREMWASYLDAKKGIGPRCGVGALYDLLGDEEKELYDNNEWVDEQRSIVRRAVGRRILETPGVIGTQDPPLDTLLTVEEWGPEEDSTLADAIADLRATWKLPDGTEFADGMEFARHINTLSMGFYNVWDPSPSDEYREARNGWAKWCRKMIKYNRKGIDSEARMKAAVRQGIYDSEGKLEAWEAAVEEYRAENKPLLEPPSVPVWVSDECIEACRRWIDEHNGLIWVNYIGLGERLAEKLGIPYYGEKGIDKKTNVYIEKHRGGAAVASLAANGTGKNLQFLWHENLWLCPPGEQSLGRTHRAGQRSPVVRNWVYLGCAEHLKSYYAAKSTKAKFAEDMTLSPQKLRYAQTSMPRMHDLEERGGARWVEKRETEDE